MNITELPNNELLQTFQIQYGHLCIHKALGGDCERMEQVCTELETEILNRGLLIEVEILAQKILIEKKLELLRG